jgi:hypothetical protein
MHAWSGYPWIITSTINSQAHISSGCKKYHTSLVCLVLSCLVTARVSKINLSEVLKKN